MPALQMLMQQQEGSYLKYAGEPSIDKQPEEADIHAYINKRMRDFAKLQGLI